MPQAVSGKHGLQRVVIHGGMHKTGTTALQHLLDDSRERLLREGVYVPPGRAPAHGRLINVRDSVWAPEALQETFAEARDRNAHTLILSNEVVSTFSIAQFRMLSEAFGDLEQTYVFCFRHWMEYLPSRWAQNCRRRDAQPFPDYLGYITRPGSQHVDSRFDLVLARAAEGTGRRPVAISFQRAQASGRGVVGALFKGMGLNEGLIADLLTAEKRVNVRPPWKLAELIRLLNGAVSDRLGLPQDALCRGIEHDDAGFTTFDIGHFLARSQKPWGKQPLMALVARRAQVIQVTLNDEIRAAENRLNQAFQGDFIDLGGEDVFPVMPEATLLTSAWNWAEFLSGAGRNASDIVDDFVAEYS